MRVAELDGRPAGVTIGFAPGDWPLPGRASAWELPWTLIAGPATVIRGIRDDGRIRERHIAEPHLYIWYLATAPQHQGKGVGRALIGELHELAARDQVPAFLETGTIENVAWYSGVGYEVTDEFDLPSGSHIWQMLRRDSPQSD